jgi:hypothetical protein
LPLLGVETAERREAAFGRTRRHQSPWPAPIRSARRVRKGRCRQ